MKQKPTVLLIESDPFTRGVYARRFAASGYAVVLSSSVEGASRLAEGSAPDIVLCDTSDGEGRGLTFVRELRSRAETARTAVLSLSHSWEGEHIRAALAGGADAYLVKGHHTPTEVVAKAGSMLA